MLPAFITKTKPKRTVRRRAMPSTTRDVVLVVLVTITVALSFVYGAVTGLGGVIGIIIMAVGLYIVIASNHGERRYIQSQWSIKNICEYLSVGEDKAHEFIACRAIAPTYNLDGEDLYYPLDIMDAASLLRPVDGDVELLRAARLSDSVEEVLVRPSEGGKE